MITVRTIDELYKDNYIWINLILNIVNRREKKIVRLEIIYHK